MDSNQPVEEKEDLVPRSSLKDFQTDMHKYKTLYKDAQAQLEAVKAEQALADERKLEEQNQWKTLYEKQKLEADTIRKSSTEKEQKLIKMQKLNAIKSKVSLHSDDLLSFVNLDNIELDDNGLPTKDSLDREIEAFKQKHPYAIKKVASGVVPSVSPARTDVKKESKSLSTLTDSELKAAIAAHRK